MFGFLPLILLGLFAAGLIAAAVASQFHTVKLTEQSWKTLVGKLQKLDNHALMLVAQDFLDSGDRPFMLQPAEIWNYVGGYDGIQKMRDNAAIMLTLAAFIQEWNFDAGAIVGERMRRDAVLLRQAVRRLELSRFRVKVFGRLSPSTLYDLQQAAASYYVMRDRLLSLYKMSLSGLYPALAEAL